KVTSFSQSEDLPCAFLKADKYVNGFILSPLR
ncbi:MAG: hypothetical protein ACI9YB_003137, partial [Halioglobus sp.]